MDFLDPLTDPNFEWPAIAPGAGEASSCWTGFKPGTSVRFRYRVHASASLEFLKTFTLISIDPKSTVLELKEVDPATGKETVPPVIGGSGRY